MEEKTLNKGDYIFKRPHNPIKGMWYFIKNGFKIEEKIKFTSTLRVLIALLVIFLLLFFTFIIVEAGLGIIGFISGLLLITFVYWGIEFVFYFLATKFSKIYKIDSIIFGNNDLTVLFYKQQQERIPYQNIQKMSFSSRLPSMILGQLIFGILFKRRFLRHYAVEYKALDGKIQKLYIPLDLSGLPRFISMFVKRTGLIKFQPNKMSLYFEWRKPLPGEKQEAIEGFSPKPLTIDPNKPIGKMVLVVVAIAITISYLIVKFFM